ncbi:MAG: hypothetical protein HQL24_04855 [Candidatus Omnitrophica bacterium]|nr:hypothetical protein [Candidatus Omnitrophota bacterium]
MTAKSRGFDPELIKSIMTDAIANFIESKCNSKFSKPPDFSEHNIIEYASNMRVFGLEKFNSPCYVSYINFFLSTQELKNKNPIGALILFLDYQSAERLLKSLGYSQANEDEEDAFFDTVGQLCETIASQFNNEIQNLGYKELAISKPLTFKNDVPGGAPFYYEETRYYELSAYFWKQKALVLNLTLGPVSKK